MENISLSGWKKKGGGREREREREREGGKKKNQHGDELLLSPYQKRNSGDKRGLKN